MTVRMYIESRAPLKCAFSAIASVSAMLKSSSISYTLRFSARHFLALTKKSLFLETSVNVQELSGLYQVDFGKT